MLSIKRIATAALAAATAFAAANPHQPWVIEPLVIVTV